MSTESIAWRRNQPDALTEVMLGAAAVSSALTGRTSRLDPKKPTKCRLSTCDNLTLHNGGYCCAEHCKQDRVEKGVK